MSGLQKPTSNNYNLMSKHEQTTLANELNTFYTRFNGTVADPGSDDGVVDVMADGDSDGGVHIGDGSDGNDRDNTAGGDCNSESTDDGQFTPITVEEVSKLFSKCKVGKAWGPDNLCTRILKKCCAELAPVFCKLFNLCLDKETLPDIWKLSAICPLPKTANPKCSNDFRPIALTSVVMKIFEQIIKSRILSHIVLG